MRQNLDEGADYGRDRDIPLTTEPARPTAIG
jgi:hypothetical protein